MKSIKKERKTTKKEEELEGGFGRDTDQPQVLRMDIRFREESTSVIEKNGGVVTKGKLKVARVW
jgi:hypothetical protein